MKVFEEKIKILHLEDDPDDAVMVSQLLKKANLNCDIKVVDTRKKFEQSLAEFRPDVIISDHNLPSFDSKEALTILKKSGSQLPFILLTGTVSDEYAIAAMREGASDYLLKDRPQRLVDSIHNALEKFRLKNEKKEVAEKIRKSEKLLSNIDLNSADMICSVSEDDYFLHVSAASEKVLGYTPTELVGKRFFDFLYIEDLEKTINTANQVMDGNQINSFENRYVRKDGSLVTLSWSVRMDEVDRIRYAVARDVTEYKKIEVENDKLARIASLTVNAVIITDAEGKITWVNKGFERITEYPLEEVIGKKPGAFLQGLATDPVTITEMWKSVMQGQSFRGEILNYGKSGRQYWLDIEIVPLKDYMGKLSGFMAVQQDITNRKKSEDETCNLIKTLQKRNQDLQQFSYIISHNLRAPIAKISGLVSIVKPDNEENKFLLEKIVEETELLDDVIKDINIIISARKSETEKLQYVLLEPEYNLVLQSLNADIVKSSAQVYHNFSEVKGITTIKSYLYSILHNLISNAIKYRQPDLPLTIHIESSQNENFICLSVKDNGRGIDLKKNMSKIFGLYKRFHGADIPGKGVGLYLVKTHVESLGGRVEIESKLDEGTEFKVYLLKNYGNNISN